MTFWQQSWKTDTKPNSTITTVGFCSSRESVRPASECEETTHQPAVPTVGDKQRVWRPQTYYGDTRAANVITSYISYGLT